MTSRAQHWVHFIERLAPKRGERILDLGCGSGEAIQRVLEVAGVRSVIGLDRSAGMLRAAHRRLAAHLSRGKAELHLADAGAELPFQPATFDAVFSAELMECLPETRQYRLLREIRRVLRPGGRVLLEHTDWDTQLWNASDRSLERRLVHAFCDWKQGWMDSADGWMGRQLLGLVRRARLFQGIEGSAYVLINDRYRPGTFGYDRSVDLKALAKNRKRIRPAEVQRFLRDLGAQDRRGAYFYSVNRYIVSGKRPS
ncbi:MAG TPA: methyltransferase domain-containing protein [Candidatus Eisenbacteria bacterium]|nr:methyltransferase domain-containing protein [Candidatus Eisenbacteria bacterium]